MTETQAPETPMTAAPVPATPPCRGALADLPRQPLEAVVIGAGQAGLTAAHHLVREGLVPGETMVVLDSDRGPGGAWQHRWDALTLGKAHGIHDLPGMPLGTPDPDVPASRIVADYYGRFEERNGLDVRRPVHVDAVRDAGRGDAGRGDARNSATGRGEQRSLLRVETDCGAVLTRTVVNATGTWDHPFVPGLPGIETFTGGQLHTRDFRRVEDLAGLRVAVLGGGISAVQFLLALEGHADTVWLTRRPPDFVAERFDNRWGAEVERNVNARTAAGYSPVSVVRTTGIPPWPEYLAGIDRGVLVSRGWPERIAPRGLVMPSAVGAAGDDPVAGQPGVTDRSTLVQPRSWQPWTDGRSVDVDVLFWNTGFRAALGHLAPLQLRERGGGIRMLDPVRPAREPRLLLVGYGASASTLGATRAGRRAAREALRVLREEPVARP